MKETQLSDCQQDEVTSKLERNKKLFLLLMEILALARLCSPYSTLYMKSTQFSCVSSTVLPAWCFYVMPTHRNDFKRFRFEMLMKLRILSKANKYGGPQVSRQTLFLKAKLSLSRQNFLFQDKTFFLKAKLSFSGQNCLSRGKTFFLKAKLSFSRQNVLSQGKTFFLKAKLSLLRQNSYRREPTRNQFNVE